MVIYLLNRIKELRKLHKISQSALASDLSVNQTTISKWESGERIPDAETLKILADYFRVTVDHLLKRDNPPATDAKKSLPSLNDKDERDIAKDLDKILNNLESEGALSFYGEPLDDETKELVKISLENSMRLAKQVAKKKFTPKKYQNSDE